MNIGKRTAFIVATILVLAACSFLGLEGCGGGDDGRTCSPPPHFTSAPGTTAVVGQQYFYEVHAFHLCDSFLPFPCSDWHAIQLPPGARVDGRFILWTPAPIQANKNFRFKIETGRDFCGNTAIQEWTVHVSPAPPPAPVPPSVVSLSPSNGSRNVPANSIISASFSKPVNPQTVTSASFLASAPSGGIAGTLQTSGSDVIFTPSSNLPYTSTITVTITTAVQDLSGTALASTYSWAFSTGATPDTSAPSVPSGLSARRISATQVDLTWNSSSDTVAVAGYKLYRNGTYVKSVAGLDTWDAGLDFNTQYSYSILAYDLAGNESPQSASIGIRTLEFLPGNVAYWGYDMQGSIVWARAIPDVAMDCNQGWALCASSSSVSAISSSVALKSDGSVWSCCSNSSTSLIFSNVTAVGGGDSGVAIQSDGTVWGWGYNNAGQLGIGTTSDAIITTPVQMLYVTQAAAVTGGYSHSLVLKSDGTVWATGDNSEGQLGDGTTNGQITVIQVPTLSNIIAIAARVNGSLALKSDGTVWAWGRTYWFGPYSSTPALVAGISNAIAISQGNGFSLALKADGTVWAWGFNDHGQLGDGGTSTDPTVPAQVTGLTNVIAVAAGYSHALALRADGTVWAWGNNEEGQLGDGTTISKNVPVQVLRLTQIKAIAASWRQSLALR